MCRGNRLCSKNSNSGSGSNSSRPGKVNERYRRSNIKCKNSSASTKHKPQISRLSCVYFNARSIMNKLSELELYIKEENIYIIGITETWISESILSSEVSLDGYTLLRKDRTDPNKTRGGYSFVCKDRHYCLRER